MATASDIMSSDSINMSIGAGVAAIVFLVIISTGPTSAFPLGLAALLPYVAAAFIICAAVTRTGSIVLDQLTKWRIDDAEATKLAPTHNTFEPRN